ncbi:extracellular solute-binding protein [Clostridium sp. MCC353]|uniref:sugar ABC transporter substrate-binding protein n=1 Tax=Clostridium sp. MCC353 TaxID=2592646 RepID=UPI00207ABBF0|nr:extracellular solute-binding protein [Clostridium sp. MCC353]MBT9779789.1 extracellular solute-binding protein [Clostridium sp. MCC353]
MKKSSMKLAAAGLAVSMLAAGLLTGCGSKAKNDPSTLRVTMALSEEEWAVMRKSVIPEFEKANNVKVEAVQVEASDVVKKLQAMQGSGKVEIDLIAQDANNLSSLVYNGLVEDLSEYVDLIPAESIGNLAEAGQFDGRTYFMPYRPNAEINYYNENKFNEYGLKVPANWDELYETAKVLKEKEGIGRVALKIKMSGDVIELAEFIRSAGGDPLVLNDEGSIEAFTYLQKLWPELSENTIKASFSSTNGFLAKDEVYYAPNWPFGANIIVKDGGKKEIKAYAGFEGPKGLVKTLGGEMLGIPAGSPNKELAVKFIQYLESKEVQETLMRENGWASFRSDAYGEAEEWQKPYFEATLEALAAAQPLPNVPYWSEAQQAINDAAKEIVEGKDVKTTLDKYAAQIAEAKAKSEAK